MEFTVNQKAFAKELVAARGAVEKESTIPVLANVLLEARGDRVFLTATNLELSIRSSVAAHVKTEGSGTLPGRKLTDYIKLLAEGDVHLKWEAHWAKLTSGRARARLAGMSRESFPDVPPFTEAESMGTIDGKVLLAMIAATEMAISTEASRFTLNGALLTREPGGLTMVATDGHRLAYMQATDEQSAGVDLRYRAIVAKKALAELSKLVSSDMAVDLGQDENHLFFRAGEHELTVRKLAGNFPDYQRVLPQDAGYQEIRLHKEEIGAALSRVLQFSEIRSRAVQITVTKGELRVHSSVTELGESEEGVPIDYVGADVEIGFNGEYLMDFLRVSPTSHVRMRFKDAKMAGELRPDASAYAGQYRYVVMPMRVA
jgi:DNA polymerase III subunit beta